MNKQRNIIPLLPFVNPKEPITKRSREESNNIFYKKIKLIRIKNNINKIISPIKGKINLSLPKIKKNFNSINNKYKNNNNEKSMEKNLSFEEKLYLKSYENAIINIMKVKPKKKLGMKSPYAALLIKGKENYRKLNKIKLNRENRSYKNSIKNISSQFNNSFYISNINQTYLKK